MNALEPAVHQARLVCRTNQDLQDTWPAATGGCLEALVLPTVLFLDHALFKANLIARRRALV
jgi:hypothetical protein